MTKKTNPQTSSERSTRPDQLYTQVEVDDFLNSDQISKENYTFFKRLAATKIASKVDSK